MLTAQVVNHAPVLRFIHANPDTSANAIAAATQRVPSNVRRDLPKLEKAGLITVEPLSLTDQGVAALAVIDGKVAAVAQAPEGYAYRFHRQLRIGALNPRKTFNPVTLEELMEDIIERGLSTNLEARADDPKPDDDGLPTNELVAGERRWRAIGRAIEQGRLDQDFPILVKLKIMDDGAHRVAALMENLQREGLTPLEEARAFDDLMKTEGLTTAQLAVRIKKSQKTVQNRIRLLKLPEDLQARMELPEDDDNHLGYKAALAGFLIQKQAPPVAPKEPAQPKLDIPPSFGLALMELAHLAQRFPAKLAEPGFVEVVALKRGRELQWLNDRKVIAVRRESDRTFAKILAYSSGAMAWLEERGFNLDADAAVMTLRSEAMNDRMRLAHTMDRYESSEIDECRVLNEKRAATAPTEADLPTTGGASPKQRASQADRDRATREANDEARLQVLMRGLPEERRDIINRAGDFITAFDASIRSRDEGQAALAAESYQACVAKLNGGTLFASEAGDDKPGSFLRRFWKAQTGDEPRWGESGEFLMRVDGVVAHVVIKGNLAHSTGVEFWAVELDKPFISNTGYTSGFLGFGARAMPSLDGAGVAVEVARLMRARTAEAKRLPMVDGEYLERRVAAIAAAPWISEALAASAVLDGVAMIDAHEAEDHDEDAGWADQDEAAEANRVRAADHAGTNGRADERGISLVAALLRQSLLETQAHNEGRWNHTKDLEGLAQNAVWHVRNGNIGEALISLMGMLHRGGEAGANEALQQHSQEKLVIGEEAHYTLGNAAVDAIPHLKAMVEAQRGRRLLPIDSDRTEKAAIALERAAGNLGFQP